ncbi:MAG TPA: prepilin-type N-terminal cleavage/methylation domain-containing protein [Thermoanaerobaculia bacterium]|jgi:prepilin-type N-terminal cleavage/methylation domain-containing protein
MKQKLATLRRRSRDAGFSLAEVIIAVALLGVILLALFALLTSGVQRAYSGKKTTQATMIAQAVMEQANVYEPHLLFEGLDVTTSDPAVLQWERDSDETEPDDEGLGDSARTQRNAWRSLLANADLPASDEFPARLTITATPLPEGRTYEAASLIRLEVDLTWTEWGKRQREVRLQSLNLPVNP